jgi:hypothetical protein
MSNDQSNSKYPLWLSLSNFEIKVKVISVFLRAFIKALLQVKIDSELLIALLNSKASIEQYLRTIQSQSNSKLFSPKISIKSFSIS